MQAFFSVKLWKQTENCTNIVEDLMKNFRERLFLETNGSRKHQNIYA